MTFVMMDDSVISLGHSKSYLSSGQSQSRSPTRMLPNFNINFNFTRTIKIFNSMTQYNGIMS